MQDIYTLRTLPIPSLSSVYPAYPLPIASQHHSPERNIAMAKVNLSRYLKSLRGKVGDFVFRHMPDGSTVVSILSKKKRRSSPAQKVYRHEIFPDRIHWAKWAYKHYPIYAELAADLPMVNAYNLAIKDISHPPVIHRVLREDGRIWVNASDEISVASVQVRIHDENGRLVEAGDAQ